MENKLIYEIWIFNEPASIIQKSQNNIKMFYKFFIYFYYNTKMVIFMKKKNWKYVQGLYINLFTLQVER